MMGGSCGRQVAHGICTAVEDHEDDKDKKRGSRERQQQSSENSNEAGLNSTRR